MRLDFESRLLQAEKEYLTYYVIPSPCEKFDFYLESNAYDRDF